MFIIIIFTILLLSGCASNAPVFSELPGADDKIAIGESTNPEGKSAVDSEPRQLIGEWIVSCSSENLELAVRPMRSISAHWNVTSVLLPPACPDCISFKNLQAIGPNKISVKVRIKHPYANKPSLDAFDVRGIVLAEKEFVFPSGTVSSLLENPDGFTSLWSSSPWARINPFLLFAKENPEYRFKSGSSHEREFVLNLPAKKIEFGFAVDACWLPPGFVNVLDPSASNHCNEGIDIVTEVSGPIPPASNSFALVKITFRDWQSDGYKAKVSLEMPDLADAPFKPDWKVGINPVSFFFRVRNMKNAPSGNYKCLVCIRDQLNNPSNDALTAFMIIDVKVGSVLGQTKGLVIYPGAVSLPEIGSKSGFEAARLLDDGGFVQIFNNLTWSIKGSNLNGEPLAKIDQAGKVERISPAPWGGTATVHAEFQTLSAEARVFCDDPFADGITVQFGKFCSSDGPYSNPSKALGPPKGAGLLSGGTDVLSLGYGGVATVEFKNNIAMNGPGPDIIVFENAFYAGSCEWQNEEQYISWSESAVVQVSQDGKIWFEFPPDYNPANIVCGIEPWANESSFHNLAGIHPVLANVSSNGSFLGGISPVDPIHAGGDAFDLEEIGLSWCRYVRIIDTGDILDAPGTQRYDKDGDLITDYGKQSPLGAQQGVAGFDLDSVASVYPAPVTQSGG